MVGRGVPVPTVPYLLQPLYPRLSRQWQDSTMRTLRLFIGFLATTTAIYACGDYTSLDKPATLARLALSADHTQSQEAIRKLRALGPTGLNALLEAHAPALANPLQIDPNLRRVLDAVGGQRDCHASRLFWYTDPEAAKTAAQTLGRPILSLRLLGRLDEEFSCANSRFFRTALYPNKEINQLLQDEFVLYWESERPAPRITIDFGDGRKLERTITGNSIHYVLAADGRVIEALPGLYGPKAFARELRAAAGVAHQYAKLEPAARPAFVREYHGKRLAAAVADWSSELTQVTGHRSANPTRSVLEKEMTPELWTALARLHNEDARLDRESGMLIRAKNPRAADAGRIAVSKAVVEDPLLRAMGEFERSIAEDTVRNEYLLHAQIHEWFRAGESGIADLRQLNHRVYAQLFLMPASDPWLGLKPTNVYSGIEFDGVSMVTTAPLR